MKDARHELVERFYRYVSVPSQSRDNGGVQVPSTEGQWDMAELLKAECEALGLVDLEISKACVLTGKLPARLPEGFAGSVPSVGFCTHMDTVDVCLSPEIHPQMIANYDGGDIVLNEEQQIVMAAAEHPELRKFVGQDIIVTDGTSVLGSDNKAAIANVMTALSTLAGDDSLYHGDIYVAACSRAALSPTKNAACSARRIWTFLNFPSTLRIRLIPATSVKSCMKRSTPAAPKS